MDEELHRRAGALIPAEQFSSKITVVPIDVRDKQFVSMTDHCDSCGTDFVLHVGCTHDCGCTLRKEIAEMKEFSIWFELKLVGLIFAAVAAVSTLLVYVIVHWTVH